MSQYKTVLSKLVSLKEASNLIHVWQQAGETIVFTNGCFDILHKGHIDYLTRAADLGHRLVVGLNSDGSVSRLKGEHRPLQDQSGRSFVMASLACVSAVVIFDEDTPENLIEVLRPDVLVKGGDYTLETVVGADLVLGYGGKVELLPFLEGYSTSAIEKKIIQGSGQP